MKYLGVGTVEFLYEDGEFYFIEMNTRIQVEHPVTEMITDIDLVLEQIRIAAGGDLPVTQDEVVINGHSIECRVNAENPVTFRPSPGKILQYHPPGGLGVRIDSAVYQGYVIPPYYDSLVGKLIVHGKTRGECLMRLRRALDEMVVDGIETTLPLFRALVREPAIIDGDYHIHWLEQYLAGQLGAVAEPPVDGTARLPVACAPSPPAILPRDDLTRLRLFRDHARSAAARLCLRHLPDGRERRRSDPVLGRTGNARRDSARRLSRLLAACAHGALRTPSPSPSIPLSRPSSPAAPRRKPAATTPGSTSASAISTSACTNSGIATASKSGRMTTWSADSTASASAAPSSARACFTAPATPRRWRWCIWWRG